MSPEPQPATGRYAGIDDATLLQQHVDGDHEAFGELFRRHQDRVWAVALRTLGDPDEAADAVQDAMINAFRRAEQFSGRSAVTTWLKLITTIPAAQAASTVGFSASSEAACRMIASGLAAMMLLSELICA